MKGKVYLPVFKVKRIEKNTKQEPTLRFWDETDKRSTQKEYIHNVVSQKSEKIEYTSMVERIVSIIINKINNQDIVKRSSLMETFSLEQGIKRFVNKGYEATYGEMLQIHQKTYFRPIKVADFNPREIKRALELLIFLVLKKDVIIKSRTCANGSVQISWMKK